MRSGPVRRYALLAVPACLAYLLAPADSWAQTGLAVGIGYLGVAGTVAGVPGTRRSAC